MGLLDAFDSDQFRLGLGLLAAGGARGDGMSTGGRIQEAFSGMDAYKRQKALDDERKAEIELKKKAREQKTFDDDAVRRYYSTTPGGQAMQNGGGPTIANLANIGQPQRLDPRQFLANNQGASIDALKQAMELDQAFNPAKKLMNVPEGNVVLDETTGRPVYTAPVRPEKPEKAPTSWQEFQLAKQDGYQGSYAQFKTLGPSIMAGAMAPLRAAQIGNIEAENDYNLPPPRRSQGGGVTVMAGGRTYTFPDQKSANNFKLKAGVR